MKGGGGVCGVSDAPLHKKKVDDEEGCSDEVVLVEDEIEDEECAPILNIFEIERIMYL